MSSQHSIRDQFIFLIVSFSLWFSHFIYLPILSPYLETMGGKYIFIGIVLSSYGLMQFIFRLPIGISSDLIKLRKPFIVVGMLISATSCLVFALTDSLGWVLLARSLAGIAAATWVVFTVLYSSYFTDQEVHRAMGSISFVVVLAQLLGMSLSGFIVNEWGWLTPFWVGAVVSILGAFLSVFIYEPKERSTKVLMDFKILTTVLWEPLLLKVSLLSILAHSIIFTTIFGFIPIYTVDIGFQASDISWIIFSFMIPHAIATLFMGKVIVPVIGKWKSLYIAFLATAFFTILTPLTESKGLLMIIQSFNGFSLGIIFPLLLGMSIESISHEKRATAMGGYQALYAIGMFTGPFLAGFLNSSFGIASGFYFTGSLGLVACLIVHIWKSNESIESNKRYKISS